MSIITVSPNKAEGHKRYSIFLAGSIGDAEDWQSEISTLLCSLRDDLEIFNPRRKEWSAEWTYPHPNFIEQVKWELDHIHKADRVLFYFDPKTQSPISLLELGFCIGRFKNIIVCCPLEYYRSGNIALICKDNHVRHIETKEKLMKYLSKAF